MTREEAIKELEEDKALYMPEEWIESLDRDTPDGRLITALDMAIKALEQQPCEDAISRQAVLDMMQMRIGGKELYKAVYNLPPVTPQPKMGRWINAYPDKEPNPMFMYGTCSVCGFEQAISNKLNFCPNCGAKMEVEE